MDVIIAANSRNVLPQVGLPDLRIIMRNRRASRLRGICKGAAV